MRLRHVDGQHRWFQFCAEPIRDDSGTVSGYCGTHVDIDDRQRAIETARGAEGDLRLILDNVPALVKTMTPTGQIDFANRQSARLPGCRPRSAPRLAVVHP